MKSIYEFTKILSVLFFLSAVGFIFSDMPVLAIVGFLAFLVIRLADSDWMFNLLQLENPNSFIVTLTFIALSVYGFFIYQEVQYAPLITHLKPEHSEIYKQYEANLYGAVSPCLSEHNRLVLRARTGVDVDDKDLKELRRICYEASTELDKQNLPEDFPKSIGVTIMKNKAEFKKIIMNLSAYNYSRGKLQDGLIRRVNSSKNLIEKNNEKVKTALGYKDSDITSRIQLEF